VNATAAYILEMYKKYELDYVQLHGEELPDFCKNLKHKGVNIIKAFSVDENFNFGKLQNYKPYCDFFLFDTKGEQRGGNGTTFDWSILDKYDNEKPFFLAGGIDLENAHNALEIKGLKIHSLDVNSKFEISPALKDIDKIEELMSIIKPEMVEV
jgi:phosphoribosylanthranilate isomerase